jgi:hypothetical protein
VIRSIDGEEFRLREVQGRHGRYALVQAAPEDAIIVDDFALLHDAVVVEGNEQIFTCQMRSASPAAAGVPPPPPGTAATTRHQYPHFESAQRPQNKCGSW